jgi:hypothetical protein
MSGVRDPPTYLLNSMNKMLSVCVSGALVQTGLSKK